MPRDMDISPWSAPGTMGYVAAAPAVAAAAQSYGSYLWDRYGRPFVVREAGRGARAAGKRVGDYLEGDRYAYFYFFSKTSNAS